MSSSLKYAAAATSRADRGAAGWLRRAQRVNALVLHLVASSGKCRLARRWRARPATRPRFRPHSLHAARSEDCAYRDIARVADQPQRRSVTPRIMRSQSAYSRSGLTRVLHSRTELGSNMFLPNQYYKTHGREAFRLVMTERAPETGLRVLQLEGGTTKGFLRSTRTYADGSARDFIRLLLTRVRIVCSSVAWETSERLPLTLHRMSCGASCNGQVLVCRHTRSPAMPAF